MTSFKQRELLSGVLMLGAGLFFAIGALSRLHLGNFSSMGPGMFPLIVGVVLGLVGLAQVALALRTTINTPVEQIEWRSLIVIAAAITVFAVTISPFGLIPAICAQIFVSRLASKKISLRAATMLAAGLSVAAWAIFDRALGLPFTLIKWPF